MKKGLDIRKLALTRIDNAQHLKFHSSVYDYIVELELAKLGIPEELKEEWRKSIGIERDLNLEAQASANSALLQKKDEDRDRLLLFIFGAVRNAMLSPEDDVVEAATRLAIVTNRYAGIQKESFDRETAHVDGLVEDLKKAEYTADVAKLGLTSTVGKLEACNKEFGKLYDERVKVRADKDMPTSAKVRPETDAIYERILLILQWNYLFGATPIDPELIATLVRRINARAEAIDAAYRQGLALKKAAAAKKPKDPKDPKQPKDPKDPKPKDPKDPKKPDDAEQPKPNPGGGTGGGDDIQIPSEPPKKPDGQ